MGQREGRWRGINRKEGGWDRGRGEGEEGKEDWMGRTGGWGSGRGVGCELKLTSA